MKFNKQIALTILRDIFFFLFALFIIFTLMELIKPKIVLNYFNLDIYLVILLVFGIITILFYPYLEVSERHR